MTNKTGVHQTTDLPLDKELWFAAQPEIKAAFRQGILISLLIGIPLGWVTLPFVLWACGMTMEFHW